MPQVTTNGLVDATAAATALPAVQWAAAAGTADIITAAYPTPNTALTDGLILGLRLSAANATNAPTFSPDGLTPHPITKKGGSVLEPGNLPGAAAEVLLRYNLANTRWELLNVYHTMVPSHWFAIATGSSDALAGAFTPPRLTLADGELLRVRAIATNTTTTPTFAADSLTAYTIVRLDGTACQVGDIVTGMDLLLEYDLANTRWKLLNPYTTPATALTNSYYLKGLAAGVAGANVNTAQPWLPSAGGVTLGVGTYLFDGVLALSRAAGLTSHTTSILFGGTATIGAIGYFVEAMTGDANTLVSTSGVYGTSTAALQVKAASTSATEQAFFWMRGFMTVTVAGTFIPQFQYSAAPGGAPTVLAGTYFRVNPITNPLGTWA